MRAAVKSILPPIIKYSYKAFIERPIVASVNRGVLRTSDSLRGKLNGKSVFIVGSGPSVATQDIRLLRDKNVIFLNNMFVHANYAVACSGAGFKAQLFAPLHEPQTETEWVAWLRAMSDAALGNHIIAGLIDGPYSAKRIIDANGLFKENRVSYYLAYKHYDTTNYVLNKEDLLPCGPMLIASAASVYALSYAAWMGVRQVYLLGMDHNYVLYENESDMRVYRNAIHQNNEMARTFGNGRAEQEFLRQFHIFRQYRQIAALTGLTVTNCSMESLCRVFPKRPYENCISESV